MIPRKPVWGRLPSFDILNADLIFVSSLWQNLFISENISLLQKNVCNIITTLERNEPKNIRIFLVNPLNDLLSLSSSYYAIVLTITIVFWPDKRYLIIGSVSHSLFSVNVAFSVAPVNTEHHWGIEHRQQRLFHGTIHNSFLNLPS